MVSIPVFTGPLSLGGCVVWYCWRGLQGSEGDPAFNFIMTSTAYFILTADSLWKIFEWSYVKFLDF